MSHNGAKFKHDQPCPLRSTQIHPDSTILQPRRATLTTTSTRTSKSSAPSCKDTQMWPQIYLAFSEAFFIPPGESYSGQLVTSSCGGYIWVSLSWQEQKVKISDQPDFECGIFVLPPNEFTLQLRLLIQIYIGCHATPKSNLDFCGQHGISLSTFTVHIQGVEKIYSYGWFWVLTLVNMIYNRKAYLLKQRWHQATFVMSWG